MMLSLLGVVAVAIGWPPPAIAVDPPANTTSQPDRSSESDIGLLIRKLGDPDYQVRTEAMRSLALFGHRAAGALERATRDAAPEVRLRAAQLLEMLDELYFGGCTVQLAVDRTHLKWNEPLTLTVTIRNECGYRAFLPLEVGGSRPAHVGLVGDLIDLADYLQVIDPAGRPVTLRVDDVRADPAVAEALDWRSEGGPVTELLPGHQVVVRLQPLNRGWARYPLLHAGVYRIGFDYAPVWGEPRLDEAGLGRVRSKTLEVRVTEPANAIVQRGVGMPRIRVECAGEHLVARMTNTDDLPVAVNLNAGAQAPFSRLSWSVITGDSVFPLNPIAPSPQPAPTFDRDRVRELLPGEAIEIARVKLAEVRAADAVVAAPPGAPVQIQVVWFNQLDRVWQRRQSARVEPAGAGRAPLPRRMIVGRLHSDPLDLPSIHRK